ncbi:MULTISPECIES: cell division protein FtsQ/DivIB [Exiguobacterium]|uniref:Division initiation protein DivIB n=1 Tax=Exiguobacterium aurantiacum TaxID=33987 RepID=A0A377FVN2_9BACL|nr:MULTISPECIES: FtsQ-type POTRA domain-containing protein [Exiguobacterium]STO08546.1 Division initiation protein DivIB [Exiguobacterium aurantiacum]
METRQNTVRSLEDRIPYMKDQRRKKANRRLSAILLLFALLIALVVYMQTSVSDVKAVNVSGLDWLSEAYVLEKIELDTNSKIVEVSPKRLEATIKSLPGVKDVDVDRSWYNIVSIDLEEEKMIAYSRTDEEEVVVLADGSLHPTGQIDDPEKLKDGPLLREFTDVADLEKVAGELEQVDDAMRARMSEIVFSKRDGEPTRYEIFMNDGNTLVTPTFKLGQTVSKYGEIFENIPKGQRGTVVMDGGYYFVPYEKPKE